MNEITPKQEMFCREYIIDFNATQAAIRSGYSKNTAKEQGTRLLTNVSVQQMLSGLIGKRNEKAEITADYVLNRLLEIDKMDALDILENDGSIKQIKDWPKIWRQFVSGIDVSEMKINSPEAIVKKIKWPDKVKNLELIGKHIDVGAFKDQVGVQHDMSEELRSFYQELISKGKK